MTNLTRFCAAQAATRAHVPKALQAAEAVRQPGPGDMHPAVVHAAI